MDPEKEKFVAKPAPERKRAILITVDEAGKLDWKTEGFTEKELSGVVQAFAISALPLGRRDCTPPPTNTNCGCVVVE